MMLPSRERALFRLSLSGLLGLSSLAAVACSGNPPASKSVPVDAPPLPTALPPASASASAAPLGPPDAGPPAPAPLVGQDFVEEAKALFRVAACGGDDPIPARFDAKAIDIHCKSLRGLYADYKKTWVDIAVPYLAKLVPKGLPTEIVYPFGGSDLMSALATFPDGVTYTTVSLETAADIRRVDTITEKKLEAELSLNRLHLSKLFEKIHSRTVNLDMESKSDLPGEIVFSMVGLAIYGYEPVSLRYFHFNADGTLRYVDASEIERVEKAKPKGPLELQNELFANVEIQFRKAGDPSAPRKTFRHVSYNLDDKHLHADPSILRHLEAKGQVSAMTKAASHCLWSDDFLSIRQYLLDHMAWMISDSTGIPVRVASKAGWIQDTYGVMEWPAAFFVDNRDQVAINKNAEDMRKLWKTNPQHDLPFRYGYPDRDHHGHLMVTHKP